MYYTYLLTRHLPDIAMYQTADALPGTDTHTHTHTHISVSVGGDTFIKPFQSSSLLCERMGGKVECNVVGERVKDASYPQKTHHASQKSSHSPDHVFSPLQCPPPSLALVGYIHQ